MSAGRFLVALAATSLSLLAAGCGELQNTITTPTTATQQLTLALPQQPNANYIGIYEAQALGYFQQAGIDLQVELPSSTGTVDRLPQLDAGAYQVTLSSAPSVISYQYQGAPIVAIATVVHGGLWQTEPIYAKPSPASAATTTSAAAATATATTTTASSATTAATTTTTPAPKITGYKLVADNSLLAANLAQRPDLPPYAGLVLVVRNGTLAAHASLLRRFVQAVGRGYEQVRDDPAAATQRVAALLGGDTTAAALQAGLARSLSEFFPAGSLPWGYQQSASWRTLQHWLTQQKLLADVATPAQPFTNELLAGQGV